MPEPTIPADVRERIIDAATALYEQSGKATFPTVDAVRRAARVDMNAASSVMKDWRRAQTAQAAPVVVAVPEAVQQAGDSALATVWTYAQDQANEALRAAQGAWEAERAELDTMRQELAEAFEGQARELETAQATIEQLRAELADANARIERDAEAASLLQSENQGLRADVEKAAARTEEIEARVADLRTELNHAHAEADRVRAELAEARRVATADIDAANKRADTSNNELAKAHSRADAQAEQINRAQAERDEARRVAEEARKLAAEAREAGAKLAGQLEATQTQNSALLAAMKEVGTADKSTKGGKGAAK
jgi:colicin import membrane protein